MDNLIYLLIIALSTMGFSIAYYIFTMKKEQKSLFCPMNFKCDEVLYGKYSKFLGIPTEAWGMIYYVFCVIGYGLILFWPAMRTPQIVSALFLVSASGFIFSVYLTLLQFFKLKELCSWCLGSALICAATFFLILKTNGAIAISTIADDYIMWRSLIYGFALVAGFVCALIYEILFLYFARDQFISDEESANLHTLSQIVSLMLGMVILFSYISYISNPLLTTGSPRFMVKVIIFVILVLSHLVHNLYASKRSFVGVLSLLSWGFLIILEMGIGFSIPIFYGLIAYLVSIIILIFATSKFKY